MIIILEGCDKTGKTTLANKLKNKYSAEIIKTNAPVENAYNEYMNKLNILVKDKNYIFDRFHIGEMVYGPLYRNYSSVNKENIMNIENILKEHNVLLIFCYNFDSEIEYNFIKNKELITNIKDIKKIQDNYMKVINFSKLKKINYSYNIIDDELLFELIKKALDGDK